MLISTAAWPRLIKSSWAGWSRRCAILTQTANELNLLRWRIAAKVRNVIDRLAELQSKLDAKVVAADAVSFHQQMSSRTDIQKAVRRISDFEAARQQAISFLAGLPQAPSLSRVCHDAHKTWIKSRQSASWHTVRLVRNSVSSLRLPARNSTELSLRSKTKQKDP